MTWRGYKVTIKKKTNWQQTDGSLEQRYRKCKLTHTKQLQGDTKLLRDIKRLQRHSKGSKKPSEQTSKQPEADTEQPEKTPSLQRCSLKWQRHTDEQKMMKMSRRPKKCVSKQTWNSCRVKLSHSQDYQTWPLTLTSGSVTHCLRFLTDALLVSTWKSSVIFRKPDL